MVRAFVDLGAASRGRWGDADAQFGADAAAVVTINGRLVIPLITPERLDA